MSVLQSASSNNAFITVELAESLRNLLNRHAYHASEPEWDALKRYDEIFSKKPDVNCRGKCCRKTDGENTNGSTD